MQGALQLKRRSPDSYPRLPVAGRTLRSLGLMFTPLRCVTAPSDQAPLGTSRYEMRRSGPLGAMSEQVDSKWTRDQFSNASRLGIHAESRA
jgi:hypothetical protein